MGFLETEDYLDKLDVEIRDYLEHHQLPQQLVDEIASRYLNVRYIRNRIRKVYPEFIREIAPLIEVHK